LAVVWIPRVSASGTGYRGSAGHRDSGHPQGTGGVRDRAAGRHQIVNDHHRVGSSGQCRRSTDVGGELAGGSPAALDRGQGRGVGTVGGQPEDGRDPRDDPGPGEHRDRAGREPLDMLAAAPPGDRGSRGHRHQPNPVGAAQHRGHRGGQRGCQHARQIPAAALLVGKQAGPRRSGVRSGDGQRWQPGRAGIRAVRAWLVQGAPAPQAQRPAGIGAADTTAREGQIGQYGEHATTVPPRINPEKSRCAICG